MCESEHRDEHDETTALYRIILLYDVTNPPQDLEKAMAASLAAAKTEADC